MDFAPSACSLTLFCMLDVDSCAQWCVEGEHYLSFQKCCLQDHVGDKVSTGGGCEIAVTARAGYWFG